MTLERDGDRVLANLTGNQSSGVLTSMIRGQGLAVVPLESDGVSAGAEIDVQILEGTFFDREERGF